MRTAELSISGENTSLLYDQQRAVEFYENRYTPGHSDDWGSDKKQRICRILSRLNIPKTGDALDFGCGNGILTEVLRTSLPPNWKVYGADISNNAIDNASRWYAFCDFFTSPDPSKLRRFDLLFTHHVLEHVYDVSAVLGEMNGYLKDSATMLHILPCGNEGSFEYTLSGMRKDGIDPSLGNRFWFEDLGHVRRLTTQQLTAQCAKLGFQLVDQYYANQYYGAINWMTQSRNPKLLLKLTNSNKAISRIAAKRFRLLRCKLLSISALRFPSIVLNSYRTKRGRTILDHAAALISLPFWPISKLVDLYFQSAAAREWSTKQHQQNGSEMYLVFRRAA